MHAFSFNESIQVEIIRANATRQSKLSPSSSHNVFNCVKYSITDRVCWFVLAMSRFNWCMRSWLLWEYQSLRSDHSFSLYRRRQPIHRVLYQLHCVAKLLPTNYIVAGESDRPNYIPWIVRRTKVKWWLRDLDVDLEFLVFRFVTQYNTRFCVLRLRSRFWYHEELEKLYFGWKFFSLTRLLSQGLPLLK